MLATSPIMAGEILFEVPRSSLLTHGTSAIAQLLDTGFLSAKK